MSVVRQRVISGTLMAAGLIALMSLDGWLATIGSPRGRGGSAEVGAWLCHGAIITALVLAFALAAAREVLDLSTASGQRPARGVAYVFTAGLVVSPWIEANIGPGARDSSAMVVLWLVAAFLAAIGAQAWRRNTERAGDHVGATLLPVLYVGLLASYLVRLRVEIGGEAGVAILLYTVLVVKVNDIGAFFVGRALGRHKLIPWLSPKKTWEGFAGGIALTVIVAVGVGLMLVRSHDTGGITASRWMARLAGLGLVMGLCSVAGDLTASLLKRGANVKDSGRLIPGMGGVLDVLDSPLVAAPVAWLFWTRLLG